MRLMSWASVMRSQMCLVRVGNLEDDDEDEDDDDDEE